MQEYKIIKLKFKPTGCHSIGVSEVLFTLRIFGYNNHWHHLPQHVWQSLQKLDSLGFHKSGPSHCMAYTSPQNPRQNSVQLQTTRANQLIISGTRFFGENLTTDLKPDSQKELKNVSSMLFPCFLAMPKF